MFTDRACHEAQKMLAADMPTASPQQKSRYLALALVCPRQWQPAYCKGKKKAAVSALRYGGKQAVTLGDFSALVDHITEYGRFKGVASASERGLVDMAWKALLPDANGGIAGQIAIEECDTNATPDWHRVEADVASFFKTWQKEKRAPPLNPAYLAEGRRGPIQPGPSDPSALFTIKNPRFLDLQLFNQNHFGPAAYRTWAGMHYTAITVSQMRCEDAIDIDDSVAEKLAAPLPGFRDIDWNADTNPQYAKLSCRLLGEVLRRQLISWRASATPEQVAPVKDLLEALANRSGDPQTRQVLEALPVQVAALALEGSGAHFMQDALSGGHIRTVHDRRALNTTRRYHDIDSKNGVIATLQARQKTYEFVAFGDTYLLGDTPAKNGRALLDDCGNLPLGLTPTPEQVSACLLRYQRGILTAANTASILDWSLGGLMYNPENSSDNAKAATACPGKEKSAGFVCAFLPLSPFAPPAVGEGKGNGYLAREGMPPTPPPVDFQSLRIESNLDGAGLGTQLGARLEFLVPFTRRGGDWLYSYDVGFLLTLGEPGRQQLIHEFAFTFHYRLATRFLINAGPISYWGFEGFNAKTNFFFGTGLGAGITILPEGWTKIPLELTLSYRAPWRFVDTAHGFHGQRLEAHWIGLSVGLAFL